MSDKNVTPRHTKMYSNSPKLQRGEDGRMNVSRAPLSPLPEVKQEQDNPAVLELSQRHAQEYLEMTQKHAKEYLAVSQKKADVETVIN